MNTQTATQSIIKSKVGFIERALGLDIGPGLDREQTLDAVDAALDRIDAIMSELDGRPRASKRVREDLGEREAFQRFMAALREPLERQADRVRVSETMGFMKIMGIVNGHRVYVSKGKLRVGRVDSTLPLGLVPGAVRPTHYNGRIASWLPAEPAAVGIAIDILGSDDTPKLR